jgi:hypothetical protein
LYPFLDERILRVQHPSHAQPRVIGDADVELDDLRSRSQLPINQATNLL